MKVAVSLFGFGEDRPHTFGNNDKLELTFQPQSAVIDALQSAGLATTHGISVMLNNVLVPQSDWASKVLADTDALTVLMAIEGG